MAERKVDLIEIQVYLHAPTAFDEAVSVANRIRQTIAAMGDGRMPGEKHRWTAQVVDIRGGEDDE